MTISQENYHCLMKLQETPTAFPAHSLHHASTSGLGTTLLPSLFDSWIIDLRASAHTSSKKFLLTRLSKLSQPSSISIADGCACSVVGYTKANSTFSLQLFQVYYVPNFLVNKALFFILVSSPKHYFTLSHSFLTFAPFKICKRGRGLVWGVRLYVKFMSLSSIIFSLGSLVSFRRPILHSNGIGDLPTLVSPNSAKLSHGFILRLLSAS